MRGGKGKRKKIEEEQSVRGRLTIPKRWHTEVEDIQTLWTDKMGVQILALPQ